MPSLDIAVFDTITVAESVTPQLTAGFRISQQTIEVGYLDDYNDAFRLSQQTIEVGYLVDAPTLGVIPTAEAVGVTDFVRAALSLAVRVFETIGVTEATATALPEYLRVSVSEAITTLDDAVTLLGLGVYVYETIGVVEGRRLLFNPLVVRAVESIGVADRPLRRVPGPTLKSATDFIRVRENVKAQLLVNGGLWARVHESIAVLENAFYIGHIPTGDGSGDPGSVGVGPDPGAPTVIGTDYWTDGV